ncbi:MAG: hypothetical protein K9L22_03775 [Methylococcaceae bacterium]|nr:hypothetical protein [Methylococcaceae bacterium]
MNKKLPLPLFIDIAFEFTQINKEKEHLKKAIQRNRLDPEREEETNKWIFDSACGSATEKI